MANTVNVEVTVRIGEDGSATFEYSPNGPAKANGDIDLRGNRGRADIHFRIGRDSDSNVCFPKEGEDAIWIGEGDSCPQSPSLPAEFDDTRVIGGGKTLKVSDKNGDGKTYMYRLRVLRTGDDKHFMSDDPRILNGGNLA